MALDNWLAVYGIMMNVILKPDQAKPKSQSVLKEVANPDSSNLITVLGVCDQFPI